MNWKDRWTKFLWKITFPGENCPEEILPSNFAKLSEKKEVNPIDALVRLVILDIEMYPDDWITEKEIYNRNTIKNKVNNINITRCHLPMTRGEGTRINGIPVDDSNSNVNWTKICEAFNARRTNEILSTLLDRVERIENVTYKDVREAKRLELVDPFMPDRLTQLENSIEALKKIGLSSMTPTRNAITVEMSKRTRQLSFPTKPSMEKPRKNKNELSITTWFGKPINQLNAVEKEEYLEYMREEPFND